MRPSKCSRSSELALIRRARFAQALSAWPSLDDYHRAQWAAFAPSLTLHDRLGTPYTPSARAAFEWFASWLCTRAGFFYTVPPYLGRYPSPTILAVAFAAGGPYNITMSMSPNFVVGGYSLDGATAKSTTRIPTRTPLFFKSGAFANDVAVNVFTAWSAVLPPLVAGEKFLLRLWGWTMNYAPSFPQTIIGICS